MSTVSEPWSWKSSGVKRSMKQQLLEGIRARCIITRHISVQLRLPSPVQEATSEWIDTSDTADKQWTADTLGR